MYTYCIVKFTPKSQSFKTLGYGQNSDRIETARKNARYSLSSNKRYYYDHRSYSSYYALIFENDRVIGEVRYKKDGTALYQGGSNQIYFLKKDGSLE